MAVADGVEHYRIQISLILGLSGLFNQRSNRLRYARCNCHFNKNQWVVGHRWMEESKTHAVLSQPRAQIVPALNRVNRFVLDDPLQHGGRGVPIDDSQLEEPSIEPGNELVLQVRVDGF